MGERDHATGFATDDQRVRRAMFDNERRLAAEEIARRHNEAAARRTGSMLPPEPASRAAHTLVEQAKLALAGDTDRRSRIINEQPPAGRVLERDTRGNPARVQGTDYSAQRADYEPPLGYSIDQQMPVGEAYELDRAEAYRRAARLQALRYGPRDGLPVGAKRIPIPSPSTNYEAELPEGEWQAQCEAAYFVFNPEMMPAEGWPGWAVPRIADPRGDRNPSGEASDGQRDAVSDVGPEELSPSAQNFIAGGSTPGPLSALRATGPDVRAADLPAAPSGPSSQFRRRV
jgi:hypothetical protein